MIKIKRVLVSVAFSCATMGFAFAADPPGDLNDVPEIVAADEWVVSTTPYFWVIFFEGDMTING